MRQKDSPLVHIIAPAVASVCIIVYIAAIAVAAIRIFFDVTGCRNSAEREFYELADRAAAAAFLGFMTQPYQDSLREALGDSKTLEGIIISGPRGDFAFERVRGTSIAWMEDRPRFRQGFGLSRGPLETPLWVEGQVNLVLRAVYHTVNYPVFVNTLKYTLIMIGAALAAAFFTLIAAAASGRGVRDGGSRGEGHGDAAALTPAAVTPGAAPAELYSPRTDVCREVYAKGRLARELHRGSPPSGEGDLSLAALEFRESGLIEGDFYRRFAGEAARFFGRRDLVFERGEAGLSVILPGLDLDRALEKTGEFLRLAAAPPFPGEGGLRAGISSRSGRSVDAERLLFEAGAALERALEDPSSPLIAFRSDPEKYRAFMASRRESR